jgi:hypothetical protein
VLFHITLALRLLPSDVRMIRGSGWAPKLPAALFNWLKDAYTRWGARRLNLETVDAWYDEARDKVLALVETMEDGEWEKGAEYPDGDPLLSGYVSLERLLRHPALPFRSHAVEIRSDMVRGSAGGGAHGIR